MIAIQPKKDSFSERWIAYCEEKKIPYKLVDCYASDIMLQLEGCSALMWHFHHASPKDILFAKQLMYSVAASGRRVFPDFDTAWHFDDKVGQKYLLEAINAPLVPTHVFYSKKEALKWVEETNFPKVFKLRGGAGSSNVMLVENKSRAIQLVRTAFGRGFSQYQGWQNLKDRIGKYKKNRTALTDVLKGIMRLFYTTEFAKNTNREKGYVLFQDFIPENDSDIRVIIVDGKAFAIKRMVRAGDFRASGSGVILYNKDNFDIDLIALSFKISERLKSQCVAFDFVFENKKPLIVEISYGFSMKGYDACPGYWTKDLIWQEGRFDPQGWMVDLVVRSHED